MLDRLSVALLGIVAVIAATALMMALCAPAKAGVYTTTITRADGTVVTCTTVTDFYGNPISINCIGG